MHRPSRPPNRPDGSTTVASEDTGGEPPPVGAAGAAAHICRSQPTENRGHSRSGGGAEPQSPSWCRTSVIPPAERRGVFQTRSIFQVPYRRSSSGYFSSEGDSLPSSPLSPRPPTATRATQTPSLTAQMVTHAAQQCAAHGAARTQHGSSSARRRDVAGDMQAIARELRHIGDDLNDRMIRRAAGGRVGVHPNRLPLIHQEPTLLLCLGLLLFLIGRYLQSSTSVHPDHSQV